MFLIRLPLELTYGNLLGSIIQGKFICLIACAYNLFTKVVLFVHLLLSLHHFCTCSSSRTFYAIKLWMCGISPTKTFCLLACLMAYLSLYFLYASLWISFTISYNSSLIVPWKEELPAEILGQWFSYSPTSFSLKQFYHFSRPHRLAKYWSFSFFWKALFDTTSIFSLFQSTCETLHLPRWYEDLISWNLASKNNE